MLTQNSRAALSQAFQPLHQPAFFCRGEALTLGVLIAAFFVVLQKQAPWWGGKNGELFQSARENCLEEILASSKKITIAIKEC